MINLCSIIIKTNISIIAIDVKLLCVSLDAYLDVRGIRLILDSW